MTGTRPNSTPSSSERTTIRDSSPTNAALKGARRLRRLQQDQAQPAGGRIARDVPRLRAVLPAARQLDRATANRGRPRRRAHLLAERLRGERLDTRRGGGRSGGCAPETKSPRSDVPDADEVRIEAQRLGGNVLVTTSISAAAQWRQAPRRTITRGEALLARSHKVRAVRLTPISGQV